MFEFVPIVDLEAEKRRMVEFQQKMDAIHQEHDSIQKVIDAQNAELARLGAELQNKQQLNDLMNFINSL